MDNQKVELVQSSFEMVIPIADQAANIFYTRLFELDPTLRGMFPDDMTKQKHKLMAALVMVVRGMKKPDTIIPVIEDLAVKHVGYGVKEPHYATVGQALLETLEKGLGDEYTPEVRAAWEEAYGMISTTMIRAAAAFQS